MKTCGFCRGEFPLDCFYRDKRGTYASRCKSCHGRRIRACIVCGNEFRALISMKHPPCIALLALVAGVSPAATHILPTPHYFEALNRRIQLRKSLFMARRFCEAGAPDSEA